MKRVLVAIGIVAILICLLAIPVVAGKNGPAGNSPIGHLYLYEKDSSTWEVVEGGAWGKMTYRLSGKNFSCVFNGHQLDPLTDYSLVKYTDPWDGDPLVVIAEGTSDEYGNVHFGWQAPVGLGNHGKDVPGYKIWLILTADYTVDHMTGWHPTEYLFEYDLIR